LEEVRSRIANAQPHRVALILYCHAAGAGMS
jgi:hypothetical protein